MIQHWSMALIYISLELAVPAILHFTLIHNDSFASWMVCVCVCVCLSVSSLSLSLTVTPLISLSFPLSLQTLPLLVVSPVFLLALLESQGLPSWLGRLTYAQPIFL